MAQTAPEPRIGVDLVAVARIERIVHDGGGLLGAVFSPEELAGGTGAEYLAGRFAGKEAVAKVLGTGFSRGVGPLEIEVLRGRLGSPRVRLTGAAAASAEAQGLGPIDLSISHTGGIAVCVAVAAAPAVASEE
ncbi:holo-ACP synthase [Sinomonas mesophila]|uniref:holo-ACP synthase n=1 Tax=Sinomonas mesophila TaxID=1531955 RepID=UPI000986BF3E|nr:holo-ACP synthase [Sinomonas mesophila]